MLFKIMSCLTCGKEIHIDNKFSCEKCDVNCCKDCFIKEFKKNNKCFSCKSEQSVQHITKYFPKYYKTCSICNYNFGSNKRTLFTCEHNCEGTQKNPVCTNCTIDWIFGNNECYIDKCSGVLNSKNTCNTCEKTFCKKCSSVKDKGHICIEEDVKKFKMKNIEKHKNCNFNCLYCKKYFTLNFCRTFMNKTQFKKAVEIYSIITSNEQLANKSRYIEKAKELKFEKRKKEIIKDIRSEINQLYAKIDELFSSIREVNGQKYKKDREVKIFVSNCPGNHCNGMLDKNYNCDLCNIKYCKNCMKEENQDHECKEDDLKTIQLLKKGTKPCPNCGAVSEKMSGCYMVWCFFCKSIWDWTHHKVINISLTSPRAHNPDLFRYLAENDIQRNDVHPYLEYQREYRRKFTDLNFDLHFGNAINVTNKFFTVTRHIDNYEIQRYQIDFTNEIEIINALFLNGDIELTQVFERNHEICRKLSYNSIILPEIQKINELFKESIKNCVDIFTKYKNSSREEINNMIKEIENLNKNSLIFNLNSFNTNMIKLSSILSRNTPRFNIYKNTITLKPQ